MANLKANTHPQYFQGDFAIKPQNVIKQILLMFTVADSSGVISNLPGVREYLLDRRSMKFPEGIRIYAYSNASVQKRMIGYCVVYDPRYGFCRWSEINFRPFGYFFTYQSPPPNNLMADITGFSLVSYDREVSLKLKTAYLNVENMVIGHYSNVKFVDEE
ncbi:hypothetical protein DDR33_24235 [Pararcticibacter amylolyticus]|uniref:Uncharacterized protein n=2 Tax=Pararcticibacter amylolyticus TaxID=2173175 RepID=A0A2U2P9J0_9SPHI|nr:hypothetical protein DDR33_24235 [Pararcticibacter amylolyticus]